MINKKVCTLILFLIATWSLPAYAYDRASNQKEEVVLKIAVNENGKATLTDTETGKTRGISPYLMTTDDEGNIVVVDLEGKVLKPVAELSSLEKPGIDNPVTKIENLTGISILRVRGSHYEIVCTSSGYYLRYLPH